MQTVKSMYKPIEYWKKIYNNSTLFVLILLVGLIIVCKISDTINLNPFYKFLFWWKISKWASNFGKGLAIEIKPLDCIFDWQWLVSKLEILL